MVWGGPADGQQVSGIQKRFTVVQEWTNPDGTKALRRFVYVKKRFSVPTETGRLDTSRYELAA